MRCCSQEHSFGTLAANYYQIIFGGVFSLISYFQHILLNIFGEIRLKYESCWDVSCFRDSNNVQSAQNSRCQSFWWKHKFFLGNKEQKAMLLVDFWSDMHLDFATPVFAHPKNRVCKEKFSQPVKYIFAHEEVANSANNKINRKK